MTDTFSVPPVGKVAVSFLEHRTPQDTTDVAEVRVVPGVSAIREVAYEAGIHEVCNEFTERCAVRRTRVSCANVGTRRWRSHETSAGLWRRSMDYEADVRRTKFAASLSISLGHHALLCPQHMTARISDDRNQRCWQRAEQARGAVCAAMHFIG